MQRVLYFIIFLGTISLSDSLKGQEIIPLYDGIIPNSKPSVDREVSTRNKDGIMITRYVSKPTLIWYKPAKISDRHSAVIICPGGGYGALSSSSEDNIFINLTDTEPSKLVNKLLKAAYTNPLLTLVDFLKTFDIGAGEEDGEEDGEE